MGKPEPLSRVWVTTDSGRVTTAYVTESGEWYLLCPKARKAGEAIVRWSHERNK
jgi:hypothetical protein